MARGSMCRAGPICTTDAALKCICVRLRQLATAPAATAPRGASRDAGRCSRAHWGASALRSAESKCAVRRNVAVYKATKSAWDPTEYACRVVAIVLWSAGRCVHQFYLSLRRKSGCRSVFYRSPGRAVHPSNTPDRIGTASGSWSALVTPWPALTAPMRLYRMHARGGAWCRQEKPQLHFRQVRGPRLAFDRRGTPSITRHKPEGAAVAFAPGVVGDDDTVQDGAEYSLAGRDRLFF